MQRVPAWLALLALALRLALPALHEHCPHELGEHHHEGHHPCQHAAEACGSQKHESPRWAPSRDAVGKHDACLACELELSTPGAPVPVPLVFAQPLRKQALQPAPPRPLLVAHRSEPQSARAPPAGTSPAVLS